MNLSSILVFSSPRYLEDVSIALKKMPGVEVHYSCPDSGRMVVIQEMPDGTSEIENLKFIKGVPHILAAELVYHYQDLGREQNISHAISSALEVLS